jgi:phosphoenolpyruvate carboxykinase (ATP)
MKITLEITRSIYDGDIDNSPTTCLENLDNLVVPTKLRSLNEDVLIPWNSWTSKYEYDVRATRLMEMFDNEMEKYTNRHID